MITTTILKPAISKRPILISMSMYLLNGEWNLFTLTEFGYMLAAYLDKCPSNSNVRVYVDKNTKYIADDFKYEDNVEFVLYDCPSFYYKDGSDHQGYIGYLIKCLPLFNWPPGYEIVWISDISKLPSPEYDSQFIDYFIKSKAKFSVHTALNIGKRSFRINFSKIEFPYSLLEKFLKTLLAGKYSAQLKIIHENYNNRYGVSAKTVGLVPFETFSWLMNSLLPYLRRLRHFYILQFYVDLEYIFKKFYYKNIKVKEIISSYFPTLLQYKKNIVKGDRSYETIQKNREITNTMCNKLSVLDIPEIEEACELFKRLSKRLENSPTVQFRLSTNTLVKTPRKNKKGTIRLKIDD
jgi:hypothetical protein